MCTWKRGSLTIEIALLMPLVFLAWMGVVSVCLFVHERAWITAAAYEAAITGSWDAVSREGDVVGRAQEKISVLLQDPWYGPGRIRTGVEGKGDVLSVFMEGRRRSYGGLQWDLHITGSRKLRRPVSFIRKAKGAKGLYESAGQIGGG